MAILEGCRHALEITVPAEEVATETERVIGSLRQKVRLPGFRPGKVPAELIRRRFEEDIRQEVLKVIVPRHLWKRAEEENLRVVGTPDITEVHFQAGEPLRFKAEFEVAPQIELKEYRDLEVPYSDPEIADEQLEARLNELREQRAEYVNVDPRPVQDGDYAVVSLESRGEPPIKQDETVLLIGGQETLPEFSENLRGLSPGEEKEFQVRYPDEYGNQKLAGRPVRFLALLKGLRRKEVPELNDEFAQDLGDYRTVEELREAVRRALFAEQQFAAQQAAKNKVVEKLVEMHEFPVPEAFLERQIEMHVERQLQAMAAQGADISKIRLDWDKLKASQRDKAARDVRASLLLDKIAEREGIMATQDEVDREVQRIARQEREPVAAVRKRLEKEGALRRIASHVRTEKTLNFLFEHARKVAEA